VDGINQPSRTHHRLASCFDDLGEYIHTNIHLPEQILTTHDRQYPLFLAYTRHILLSAAPGFSSKLAKILPYINILLMHGKSHADCFRSNGLNIGKYCIYAFFSAVTLIPVANMGKSQSKLSQEQLADLQKNTYCAYRFCLPNPQFSLTRGSRQEGTTGLVGISHL
jgi:hypothetical protein